MYVDRDAEGQRKALIASVSFYSKFMLGVAVGVAVGVGAGVLDRKGLFRTELDMCLTWPCLNPPTCWVKLHPIAGPVYRREVWRQAYAT